MRIHSEIPGERIKTVWPDIPPMELQLSWERLRETGVWKRFYTACIEIGVMFDNYVTVKGGMSCRVYTERPNRRMPAINDLIYLSRGEGHDAVSCSIDGLRNSGRSSLRAWSAALEMQIEQLVELTDGRAADD